MSHNQPIIEDSVTVENRAGFFVPESQKEHLKWWLHQIPFMQVETPDVARLAFYAHCCTHEASTSSVPDDVRNNFSLKVFEKRMNSLGMIATPWMSVFIAGICSNPAEIVLWCFFLKVHAISHKSNLLSMQDLGIIFPNGLPTLEGMKWMWDLQKLNVDVVGPDNLLDRVRMRPNEA